MSEDMSERMSEDMSEKDVIGYVRNGYQKYVMSIEISENMS